MGNADDGIQCNTASPTVQQTHFAANGGSGIWLTGTSFPDFQGDLTADREGIGIAAVTLSRSGTYKYAGIPYILAGNLVIPIATQLSLEPGVIFKGNSYYQNIIVDGRFEALGTAERPIHFTSYNDDLGGDTNQDGQDEEPTQPSGGDWGGIKFRSGSTGALAYVHLRYGGGYSRGLLEIDNAQVTLVQSHLTDSSKDGIWYGEYLLAGNPPAIHQCNIFGNAAYGIRNADSKEVDATQVWWGDATGPYHKTLNPTGQGDAVTDQVLFSPFLTGPIGTTIGVQIAQQPQSQVATNGQTVTLTVRTTGTWPITYQWHKNGVPIAEAMGATLVLDNVQAVDAGIYTVVVSNASGSLTSAAATLTVTVNQPPIVSLTSPTNNATFTTPATIALVASASDSDGTIAKVEFFAGSTKLGEDTTAPYNFTWNNVAAGTYALSAKATDNQGAITTSIAVAITVSSTVPPASTLIYTFTTLAGNAPSWGDVDGTGSGARFNMPTGVAVDSAGNVYVGDCYNDTIRKLTPDGVVTTLAGLARTCDSADGTGSAARFCQPAGVAMDGAGNLYVADKYNFTIRKVTPGGVVTTLAGLAGSRGYADGTGSAARFNYPEGVAVDSAGNVYVADTGYDTIRKVTPDGVVTTLAGDVNMDGSADGTGSAARFYEPRGLALDSTGNLYVADSMNHTIRKMTPGRVVTTLAGLAGSSGSADGTGSTARFDHPTGVAVDSAGNVYVGDTYNDTIRKVTPDGVVTTLAGLAGTSGRADGTGSAARFQDPSGIAVDSAGTLYVADANNNTIRIGAPTHWSLPTITLSPQSQAVGAGSRVVFTVTATSTTPLTYQWRKNGADIADAIISCLILNNVQATNAGSYAVVVSNASGSVTSDLAILTVNQPPTVRLISPTNNATLIEPATILIEASASDADGTVAKVEFYSNTTKLGEDMTAPYTFVWENVDMGQYSLTAKAIDNAQFSAISSASVVIVEPSTQATTVVIFPPRSIAVPGATVTFAAMVGAPRPLTCQWQKEGQDISRATNMMLTLPSVQSADAGNYTAKIVSVAGSATSEAATLTVVKAVTTPVLSIELANGAPRLTVTGTSGGTYAIQAVTDLSPSNTWQTMANVQTSGSTGSWTDAPPAGQQSRYYRALGLGGGPAEAIVPIDAFQGGALTLTDGAAVYLPPTFNTNAMTVGLSRVNNETGQSCSNGVVVSPEYSLYISATDMLIGNLYVTVPLNKDLLPILSDPASVQATLSAEYWDKSAQAWVHIGSTVFYDPVRQTLTFAVAIAEFTTLAANSVTPKLRDGYELRATCVARERATCNGDTFTISFYPPGDADGDAILGNLVYTNSNRTQPSIGPCGLSPYNFIRDLESALITAYVGLTNIQSTDNSYLFAPYARSPISVHVANTGANDGNTSWGGDILLSNTRLTSWLKVREVAAHELVHRFQGACYNSWPLGWYEAMGNRWFIEAAAQFYSAQVCGVSGSPSYESVRASSEERRRIYCDDGDGYLTEYLTSGLQFNSDQNYYAVGHFLEYLDLKCPGIIADTLASRTTGGSDAYHLRSVLMERRKGNSDQTVVGDMLTEYLKNTFTSPESLDGIGYHIKNNLLNATMASVFSSGINQPVSTLVFSEGSDKDPTERAYYRLTKTMPPLSATYVRMDARMLKKRDALLVIQASVTHREHWLKAFAYAMTNSTSTLDNAAYDFSTPADLGLAFPYDGSLAFGLFGGTTDDSVQTVEHTIINRHELLETPLTVQYYILLRPTIEYLFDLGPEGGLLVWKTGGIGDPKGLPRELISGYDVYRQGVKLNSERIQPPAVHDQKVLFGSNLIDMSRDEVEDFTVVINDIYGNSWPPIKKISISPLKCSMGLNSTSEFTASTEGVKDPSVAWSLKNGALDGDLFQQTATTTQYRSPFDLAGTNYIVATSVEDPKLFAEATVIVTGSIEVTPVNTTIVLGEMVNLTFKVTGVADKAVTWHVQEGDNSGSFAFPAPGSVVFTPSVLGNLTLVATNAANATLKGVAHVLVRFPIDIAYRNITANTTEYTAQPRGGVPPYSDFVWYYGYMQNKTTNGNPIRISGVDRGYDIIVRANDSVGHEGRGTDP
ncbi:MAG: Ig-like domain-containing protein [Verrucomicrobiota bacterium]